MSYLPPEKKDKNAMTPVRIWVWILGAGAGAYLLISGIVGIANNG